MLTIFVLVIGLMTILAVLLLVIVVIGIRQEPPSEELNEQALSLIALFVRRLLGLYVRKPHSSPNVDQGDKANAPCTLGPGRPRCAWPHDLGVGQDAAGFGLRLPGGPERRESARYLSACLFCVLLVGMGGFGQFSGASAVLTGNGNRRIGLAGGGCVRVTEIATTQLRTGQRRRPG